MRVEVKRIGVALLRNSRAFGFLGPLSFASVLLGGCVLGIAGSGNPQTSSQQKQKAYFTQAQALQNAAKQCKNSECADAELTAAVKVYEQILKLNPLNQFAYYDLGVIYISSDQSDAAATALQKSLLIAPNYFPAIYNLAFIESAKQPDQAITLYQQAAGIKGATAANRAKAYANLGVLYDNQGKRALGDAAITQALTLDPALSKVLGASYLPGHSSSTTSTSGP